MTGKPYTSVDEIKSLLKRQMLEPVKWEQGTLDLITLGCTQYVEPGPGKQLKAMMRRINQDAWCAPSLAVAGLFPHSQAACTPRAS